MNRQDYVASVLSFPKITSLPLRPQLSLRDALQIKRGTSLGEIAILSKNASRREG